MADLNPTDLREAANAEQKLVNDAARELKVEEDDIRWLMGDKRGRRVVWRVLSRGNVFQPSFNPNALVMAFGEGKRNEATILNAQVVALCPEQYLLMLKEHRTK